MYSSRKLTPKIFDAKRLYQYGIYKLSRMEHGSKDLARKMSRFQPDEKIVSEVIQKLQAQGYLDDARFARMVYNNFCRRESPRKIAMRLQQKGVAREVVQSVLEGIREEQPEEDLPGKLSELLARKYRKYDKDNYQKMTRFLVGRGFSYGESQEGIGRFREACQEGEQEQPA